MHNKYEYDHQQNDKGHCAWIFLRRLDTFSRKVYGMSPFSYLLCVTVVPIIIVPWPLARP